MRVLRVNVPLHDLSARMRLEEIVHAREPIGQDEVVCIKHRDSVISLEIDLFEGPPEVPRFPQWLSAPCEHPRASVRRDCRGAIAACVRDHIRVEMVTGIFLRHEAVEEVADDYGLVMGGNQDRESTRYLRERGW